MFFTFKKSKYHLHAFKISQRLTKFEKSKYGYKLQELLLLFTNQTSNTHHVCKKSLTYVGTQAFICSMLDVYGHEVLPHIMPRVCNFTFLLCMLLQNIELWHQQLFPFVNLTTYFAMDHV